MLIPTLNEAGSIGRLLEQLQSYESMQIIVCDGGSSDETLEIVQGFDQVELLQASPGRGCQLNKASTHACGEIIWILHADSVIPANAPDQIRAYLADPKIAMGCFWVQFDDTHPILSLYGFFSRFDSVFSTFGDQGFFMTRAAFEKIGGCPDWRLFEDVAMRRSLARLGRIVKVKTPIITSARRFARKGVIRGQVLNLYFLIRFLMGSNPNMLAQAYYRKAQAERAPGAQTESEANLSRRPYLG